MPAARTPLATRWCFTINNPAFDLPFVDVHQRISFLIYQKEVGENGTPHIQGYLETSGPRMRRSWLVSNVPWLAGAHIDVARGTAQQNIIYCTKDETRIEGPFRFGLEPAVPPGAGHRSDLHEVMDLIRGGASNYDLFVSHPSVMARYATWVSSFRATYLESLVVVSPLTARPGWQMDLDTLINGVVSRRKVVWVWSTTGDEGKSYYANHYDPKISHVLTGGKHADIYYTLSQIIHSKKVIFFDYGRSGGEMAYPVIEKLKDGMFTSTKYESRTIRFNPVHVIVMANHPPDTTKLSLDRWDIRRIDEV
uniref:Replication protein n=1 Tax=Cressdnaviricota sp. TaxID=2748378 RepID=A0A7G8LJ14_9VIRU|nr:replication protein [Cressdnaviricota sp.]